MLLEKIITAALNRKLSSLLAIFALAATASAAPRLMQGPMLGNVTTDSATIWARVGGEHELSIRYSESPMFIDAKETAPVKATAANDFCVTTELTELLSGTFYYYQVLLDGQQLDNAAEREGYPLLTAPDMKTNLKFSIAFGSGAKAEADGLQAIWLQVQNARPHTFIWLGDNAPVSGLAPQFQAEQYRKQRNVPFLQPLLRSIPQLATWDAPRSDTQSAQESLDVFKRYWANPCYGTQDAPGAYFKYHYGGVDFFILDSYTYRDENNGSTILGESQLAWLKSELAESDATFKILISGSSWSNPIHKTKNTWIAAQSERDALFAYIKEKEINGVTLLSGDDDEAEIKAIPMSSKGGYDLYELVSSPLAQEPQPNYDEDAENTIAIHEPYSESMNFGLLTFDMDPENPSYSFEIIDVFGKSVFPEFTVKASELQNGVASWKEKVDAETLAYFETTLAQQAAN
ncbi:MAG: alkaline phosphatase D family protein [Verrucomicrobiota bacterium]